MISRATRAPGLGFEVVRPIVDASPLRSDVAAFVGPTRRGPIAVPTRVEGWREYRRLFGDLDRDFDTPYAIRGYFENGGDVAWIVRCSPPRARVASVLWDANGFDALGNSVFRISASSPGPWANGARVTLRYRGRTTTGTANVDITVRTADETEELRAIPADTLLDTINASRLIRIEWVSHASSSATPRAFATQNLKLDTLGSVEPTVHEDYLDAIRAIADVPEAALVAFPDLHDLGDTAATKVLHAAAESADELHDRMVIADLPRTAPRLRWHVDDILIWVRDTLARGDDDKSAAVRYWRTAALYHPWVRVADPLGGAAEPTREIPPSGHVAGVISKLDRERGAHSTPANTPLLGVIDLHEDYVDDEQALLNPEGVDLLRCVPAIGFTVWGGRTLDRTNPFVAHRRLIHRLVRAIRRVAEPLVFETNGPVLWFTFVRAITAVLLEAWRSGSLAGNRPEEAFRVTCDETTNPPEEVDLGRCLCAIEVAPAIPMEFILVRVALSRDGALEVLA